MRFIFKTSISSLAIEKLARQKQLDAKNTYIQAMFQKSEKLVTEIDILEFENKGFIEALKIEKQKKSKGKRLNLLDEKNNNLQLFFASRVKAAQEFLIQKKVDKKQHKNDIKN